MSLSDHQRNGGRGFHEHWCYGAWATIINKFARLFKDPGDRIVISIHRGSETKSDQGVFRVGTTNIVERPTAWLRSEIEAFIQSSKTGMTRNVALQFSQDLVLRAKTSVPISSHRTLNAIVVHELARLAPTDPATLYYDFIHAKSNTQPDWLEVTIRMVQKSVVDAAIAFCRDTGLRVGSILLAPDVEGVRGPRFPINRMAFVENEVRKHATFILATLAVLLVISVIGIGISRAFYASATLNDDVADASSRVKALEHLQNMTRETSAQIAKLSAERDKESLSELLATLSDTVPDDSWFHELLFNSNKIRVMGNSRSAAELMNIIGRSNKFTNVEFEAPVTQSNPGDTEHFDMSFDVRKGGR